MIICVVLNSGICVRYSSVLTAITDHCTAADGNQTYAKYVVLCFSRVIQVMSIPAFQALKREVVLDIADMLYDPAPNGIPDERNMRRNDALSNGSAFDILYK